MPGGLEEVNDTWVLVGYLTKLSTARIIRRLAYMNEWMRIEHCWMTLTGKNRNIRRIPCPNAAREIASLTQNSLRRERRANNQMRDGTSRKKNWVKTTCQPRVEQWNRKLEQKVWPRHLTLNSLTWKIWWAPNNASRWQMGFNSAFKGSVSYGGSAEVERVCWAQEKENGWGFERRRKWLVSKRLLRNSLERPNTNRRNLIPHTR